MINNCKKQQILIFWAWINKYFDLFPDKWTKALLIYIFFGGSACFHAIVVIYLFIFLSEALITSLKTNQK